MRAPIDVHIGKNIARIRKQQGYTTAKLAEISGLSPLRIAQFESGRSQATTEELYKLKEALGTEIKEFYKNIPPDELPLD